MYDERKSYENHKGDEERSKVLNNQKANKPATTNLSKLLGKGIKRYDKALEKLSKN